MQIPWSELVDALSEILVEDAIDRASEKGIRISRAQLQTAARTRTLSAIDGDADAGELRERILKSPAFSEARARIPASLALNGKGRA